MSIPGHYETYLQQMDVAHLPVKLLRVKNIDALYEDLVNKGEGHEDVKDERIPYWAELWPSALALAEYITVSGIDWKGKKVLEIGCGFALPGIVAGMLGADVTLTDYLPEALEFAKSNWELNIKNPAKIQQLDWRTIPPGITADIVLASDVAYEKRSFSQLMDAFKILATSGCTILLSEPSRDLAKPFVEMLEKNGYAVKREEKKVFLNGKNSRVIIFELRSPVHP